jgi:FixJ family two-component response regulator
MTDRDGRRLIAIVDDDESLRRSVRNLLTSVGFHAESFASAEAFLEWLHRDRASCLVLDLRMPGMSGLDLLAHLNRIGVRIPAIILTAHGDDEARRQTARAGAVAFLGKPFRGDVLVDAVRAALSEGSPVPGADRVDAQRRRT